MINPATMSKERVFELCRKSKFVFNAKWRWRKLCNRHGITIEMIEKQMDDQIEVFDKKLKKYKEKHEKLKAENGNDESEQLGTTDGSSDQYGSPSPEEVSGSGNRGTERSSGEVSGNEVRSGQTEDGSNTPVGSK